MTFLLSEGGAQGKPVTVSELFRRGELNAGQALRGDEAVRVELLLTLTAEYYSVGDQVRRDAHGPACCAGGLNPWQIRGSQHLLRATSACTLAASRQTRARA